MVTGMVRVLRDTEGKISEVVLAVGGGSIYNIVLDERGKRLGLEMEGGKVEATGTVCHKDGTRWLELETYRSMEEWEGTGEWEEDWDEDLDDEDEEWTR